jgi:hypothetical protein
MLPKVKIKGKCALFLGKQLISWFDTDTVV